MVWFFKISVIFVGGMCIVNILLGVVINIIFIFYCINWDDFNELFFYEFVFFLVDGLSIILFYGYFMVVEVILLLGDFMENYILILEIVVISFIGLRVNVLINVKVCY